MVLPNSTSTATPPPILTTLMELLDGTLLRYFPDSQDADDGQAKMLALREGVELEDDHQPLILLLRKLAAEDQRCRASLRARLLPIDM